MKWLPFNDNHRPNPILYLSITLLDHQNKSEAQLLMKNEPERGLEIYLW